MMILKGAQKMIEVPEIWILSILIYRFLALTLSLKLNALINTLLKIAQRLNTVNVIMSMSKLAQRLNARNVTFLMTIVDPLIMLRHNQRVNRAKMASAALMASADQIRMRVLRIYPILTVPRFLMIPLLSVKLTLLNLGVLTPWPVQIKVHGVE